MNRPWIGVIPAWVLTILFARGTPVHSAAAQEAAPNLYAVREWGEAQEADLGIVNAAAQTTDGYLWFGSGSGLYRFNGVTFRRFDLLEVRSRQMRLHVTALLADRSGGLWIGSRDEGLFHCKNGRFTVYRAAQGITNDRIITLFEDASGAIWVGTDGGGAFRGANGRFESLTLQERVCPLHPTAFGEDPSGRIWMGTHADGVLVLRSNRVEEVFAPLPRVSSLHVDRQENIWIGTIGGLGQVVNGQVERVSLLRADGQRRTGVNVTSMSEDKSGNLWIATTGGLVRFQNDRQEYFGAADGLGDGFVNTLFADREGSVWASTAVGDLHQLHRQQIKLVKPFPGALQRIHALALDSRNRVWVGGPEGMAAIENNRPLQSPGFPELPGYPIFALGEDAAGRLWFSGRSGEWGFLHNGALTNVAVSKGSSLLRGASLFYRTRTGEFWAGTQIGLFRIGPEGYLGEIEGSRLSHPGVSCICDDAEGALWVGTGNGLNRVLDGEVEVFTHVEGRPIQVVFALHADRDGAVWIGTERGLWRFLNGKFFAYGNEHGAPPAIGQILEDDAGNLWLGGGGMVLRVSIASLNAVAEGWSARIKARLYNKSDGLASPIFSARQLGCKTDDGLICFAAQKGVILVHPDEVPRNEIPPPVRIEEVVVNGEPQDWSTVTTDSPLASAIVLPPGYNRLEIHYAALSYLSPDRIQFSYRLRGLSDSWEVVGDRRVAFLRALPPGEYEFEVAAANESLVTSPEPARVRIVGLAPWWQTTQFRIASMAGLLAAVGWLYSLRVRRLKQLNQARQEFSTRLLAHQENERSRLAKELHDGLGQDLLIIKNQVAVLERDVPPERTDLRERTQQISSISQSAIDGARSIAYNLRPADLDRAGLTSSIEAMIERAAASSSIQFDHDIQDIDRALPKDQEVLLYRISQELVNNILKHSGARRAVVDLQRTETGHIELTVSDNGKGFDFATVAARVGAARGLGLDSLKERVAMLKGELTVQSRIREGTRFRIRIPTDLS